MKVWKRVFPKVNLSEHSRHIEIIAISKISVFEEKIMGEISGLNKYLKHSRVQNWKLLWFMWNCYKADDWGMETKKMISVQHRNHL